MEDMLYHFLLLPSLALLVLVLFQERRCRQQKAAIASLKKESHFYRYFRHELLNHPQIIMCLSQLGKHDRLQKALGSLSEKLKVFGEINRLPSPALIQALGDFIFTLPAETPLSYTYDLALHEEDRLSGDAAQMVTYLTDLLKNRKVDHVSLEISRKMDAPLLEIAATVARAEEPQKSLRAGKSPWTKYVHVQAGETGAAGILFCSISLTQTRPLMKFAPSVNNKVVAK